MAKADESGLEFQPEAELQPELVRSRVHVEFYRSVKTKRWKIRLCSVVFVVWWAERFAFKRDKNSKTPVWRSIHPAHILFVKEIFFNTSQI